MKQGITLIFLIGLCLLSAHAQDLHDHDHGEPCATVEYNKQIREQYPELGTRRDFEEWMKRSIAESEFISNRELVTLPVVVHIIHEGDVVGRGSNISFEQIMSQIDVVNEDFRKAEGTRGFNNNPVGADAEIEFCPAEIGPNGEALPEAGVHRVNVNDLPTGNCSREGDVFCQEYIEGVIKPQTSWDPTKYCNIWVVPVIESNDPGRIILGYARFPTQSGLPRLQNVSVFPANDGVVVGVNYFGSTERGDFPLNANIFGRTLTHELGHWLGLIHIWGDGGCNVDDECADTPDANGSSSGCPTGKATCGSPDMIQNYMDYSNDACMNIFTQDQKSRMRVVLERSPRRRELRFSNVCERPSIPPIAGYSFDNIRFCNGVVLFSDESINVPTEYEWDFGNGETSSEPNPIVQYQSSGIYSVSLTVTNVFGENTVTKDIDVSVRGATNVSAGSDLGLCLSDVVQIEATAGGEFTSIQWEPTFFLDDPNSLTPTFTAPPFESGVPYKYFLKIQSEDGCLVEDSVLIDVSNAPELFVTSDKSIEFGESVRLNASGADFYEWSPPDGMNLEDVLTPSPVVSPVKTTLYTVTGTNGLGCSATGEVLVTVNNAPNSLDAFKELGTIAPAYPNPASNSVNFAAEMKQGGNLKIELYDFFGKEIGQIYEGRIPGGSFRYTWNVPMRLSAGAYYVSWEMEGRRFVQKLQLM